NVSTPYEVRPALARFAVDNRSNERIDLRIDGAYLGAIDAGSRRTYTGWTPGQYEISAQGSVSRALQTVQLQLHGSGLETWTVFASEGALLVENERSEQLRILVDGRELGTVNAKKARRVELSVGPHLLELVGLESKAHFAYRLKIKADRTITTVCPAGPAALQIVNMLDIPLSVAVGDRILGTVPSGGEHKFLIYERGDLDFRATAVDAGGPTYYRRLNYREDSLQTWRLKP
ncbi:MAG: hypothetical protein VX223_18020, partial [Myxococcota bacterium]|nr:hypothetical protein [Myxococcota bacterium]